MALSTYLELGKCNKLLVHQADSDATRFLSTYEAREATSGYLALNGADAIGLHFRFSSSATGGTTRGMYLRQKNTGTAGGEALRSFMNCESDTPADTVNGAHISLSFGTTTGNVTGLGTASRHTLHVPSRSIGGTVAAIMPELWADGTASTVANGSFIRCTLGGNATGLALIEDAGYVLSIAGGTNATGNMVNAAGNEPTWTAKTHLIRCNLNGTVAYLVAIQV